MYISNEAAADASSSGHPVLEPYP